MPQDSLTLDEYMPYRLAVASNAVSTLIATAYESLYGLKIPEWRLIFILREDGPSTQQALVKRGGMDKVTISRAAQSLAKRRLITRAPHEHDGRSHHLILTHEGERLYADVAPAAAEYEKIMLADFSPEEVTQFKKLLRRVEDAALKAQNGVEG
ncbi:MULTISPECIES: MarR family winged helix-turn-helix transcriptional regulator [unclassified Asticcacaulis]|uniref:MarR family winged helix-turn-helix transcriptional regulator n=1 Tax=unclassified Asticcacaulis TaxID=2628350 RepID=UPI0003C3CC0F|nr:MULTISPECIES: MarR family winged helix-turn-helix transcriptional regulator [unclassified Asticcacaulis]ESQ81877.1 MarR family transcriptional regulator [Asticcacaulis sp. AC466]MDV6330114.1 MarR family winged helix-turn-helix transcriptional regulator [Asticcacaulis sp. 201]